MTTRTVGYLMLTAALISMTPSIVAAYEDYSGYVSAVASNENAYRQANFLMDNLADLEAFFKDDHQDFWMTGPVIPGTDPWTVVASHADIPMDWNALLSGFTSALVSTTDYGVIVYPLLIQENPTNHQVQYIAGGTVIHTMPTVYTNTSRYATNAHPNLYSGGYNPEQIAEIEAMYAPSRLVVAVDLVRHTNLYALLYNQIFASGEPNSYGHEVMEDTDGDGVSNRDEIRWGTDPNDPGSFPGFAKTFLTNSNVAVSWPAPSNRNYQVERRDDLLYGDWSTASSWIGGNDSLLTHEDSSGVSNRFFRYRIQELDVNGNGLPDWWEYKYWGGLTTNTPSGDNDGDGLDNGEELYFGYSPLVSERELIHSIYRPVVVNNNSPNKDDGTERFDFHGGGRPLSLTKGSAQEAWSGSQATLYGRINTNAANLAFHSGGAFFNNNDDMMYLGVYGMERETDNAWVFFIDSNAGGVTNLRHLSGQPSAIGNAKNIHFDATQFTPNVAIILGANDADGKNYPGKTIGGNEVGQGVYDLATGANFPGFNSTTGGCYISQWSQGQAEESPNGGVEVALSLEALGCAPGDTVKVAAILVGGTSTSNRWASPLVYGKSVSSSGGGFQNQTIIGAPVQLGSAAMSLPNPGYPGFTEDDVLLQGFYWNTTPEEQWWNTYANYNLHGIIANAGFAMIWLPPAYKGSNAGRSVGYDPYDHYDLGEYYQAGGTFPKSTRTLYGLRSELEWLIGALKSNGVQVLEDIVLNHMVGGANGGLTYTNYPTHTNAPQFYKTSLDFHPSTNGHNDIMFPYHNDYGFSWPPEQSYSVDIAHLVPNMRLGLKQWGNWLANTVGFQGWRLDLTQGVEPWYIWEWLHYRNIRPGFAFLEYWEPANGREMQEWLDLTGRKAAIYDSHLRELLKQMCESGNIFDMRKLIAPSLLGLEPDYTIVYLDNHDTFRTYETNSLGQATKPGIMANKPLGYAYAFHSKGLPMVFWREYFDYAYLTTNAQPVWGTKIPGEINRLIKIRKKVVAGPLTVLHADADVYAQERAGGGSKHKSMLVINDFSSARTNTLPTTWFSTVLVDLVATSGSPHMVTSGLSGSVTIVMPAQSYRIYSITNALNEVNNP